MMMPCRSSLAVASLCGILLQAATPETTAAQVPAAGQSFRDCDSGCPEMVVVPAGSFMMGSQPSEAGRADSEGPVRRVVIPAAFAVGRYEVTYDEWDACIRDGACPESDGIVANDQGWGRGRRPVVEVNHGHALGFAKWLSAKTGKPYRLLSEAEWEYAARAGTNTTYSTGRAITTDQANFDTAWDGMTREVGAFPPNAFGLHDMHGNADEWVADCWSEQSADYAGRPSDGTAYEACSSPILRGGGWNSYAVGLRSAQRNPMVSGYSTDSSGFRVARAL